MPNFIEQIANVLQQVDRPGSFCIAGNIDIHTPRLEVTGVGSIALPLLPMQAEQLINVAEPAPYGRSSETIIDPKVRRTWQVDAQQVQISGRHWKNELNEIVTQVTTGLGVIGEVTAEPYKLLIYNTGSFFVTHRDTEKAPGMFATLVLVLPCEYQGGTLRVKHQAQEQVIDLHPSDPSEIAFAAFYADCQHEVLPIIAGYRIALIYNLIRKNVNSNLTAPNYAHPQKQLQNLLQTWTDSENADTTPIKLIYPLEHAYTQAELNFHTLKGKDASVGSVLMQACAAANCDCFLALLTLQESGSAEYGAYFGDRDENENEDEDGYEDDENYVVGKESDVVQSLEHFRHPDGYNFEGELPFLDEEICPANALDDFKKVQPEFQEATGNAGASFERTYQRTVLTFWPQSKRGEVVIEGGQLVSLAFFKMIVHPWIQQGKIKNSKEYQEIMQLVQEIRANWNKNHIHEENTCTFLEILESIGDIEQRSAFVTEQIIAANAYNSNNNKALTKLLHQLSPDQASEILRSLITNLGEKFTESCFGLLLLCIQTPALAIEILKPAAVILIECLTKNLPQTHKSKATSGLVTTALTVLEYIDSNLAQQVVQIIIANPKIYLPNDILVPAVFTLSKQAKISKELPASYAQLCQAAVTYLEQITSIPLEPPADWRTEHTIDCACKNCMALKQFLADPKTQTWNFKAAETERKHLEYMVKYGNCDLDLTTIRNNRPYTLSCTKNQASYKREYAQRQKDMQNLAKLRTL